MFSYPSIFVIQQTEPNNKSTVTDMLLCAHQLIPNK